MSPDPPGVLRKIEQGVATLTLNRPERMNAYTIQMGLELDRAMRDLDADDAVRVIVVTGAKEGVISFLEKRDPQWSLHPSTDLPAIPDI